MKTKNYFKKAMLLFLVCSAQIIMAQVPSYVPTNGLKAYYPFNGNANDASGNANNGTVNGATLTTDRFGSANSAYSFNGVSNYINIANNILPTTSTSLTVSLWFLSSDNDGHLISDRSGAGNTNKYSISTGGSVLGSGCENGNCSGSCGQYLTTIPPSGTSWNNAVLVKDMSSNVCKIYLNGVLASTRNNFCYTNFSSPTAIGRGNSFYTPDGYINGKIDDIGIWNRALTEAEITTMYNGVNYPDTCDGLNGTLLNGLAAYYPFCGNANDQSGNGHNGAVTGATLTTDRFGNPNSAYNFNGTSSYIYAGNISSLTGTSSSSTSVSLWMKSVSSTGEALNLLDLRSTNNTSFELYKNYPILGKISTNHYLAPLDSYLQTPSNSTLNDNQWYHVIYVLNNATGRSTLYIDGIQVGEVTGNTALLTNPKLNIGSRFDVFNSRCCFFKGAIDDICFWNRELTQQEITNLYNANQCTTNITVTDTLIINVGQLSFNDPVTYANNITIAPNPASTQININFNNITNLNGGTLKVINSLGQEVATTPITTSGTQSIMQLATWGGTGMYFVQIINPQGIVVDVKKIILQ
jgi:hypothetical protein